MASSDEEEEIVPGSVSNYLLIDSRNAPISFSSLPLHWSDDHQNVIDDDNGDFSAVYMHGTTDEGLLSVYKEVIAWKLELSSVVPEVYVLSKCKSWIKLEKPRKSYKHIVKSVLIVVRCLHFVRRNIESTRDKVLCHLMETFSSDDMVDPIEKHLSAYVPLIQSAVAIHTDLAKSKFLETFLMEIENPGRRKTLHEGNQTTYKSKFVVFDDEMEDDEDFDNEAEIFDSVCAYCDNGGDILSCEGQCIRSFHPTIHAGAETRCESLGFTDVAQYEALPTFLCGNCRHQRHQCFDCGELGSSDKSSAEVFRCVAATCGHFYHPKCVAKLLYPSDESSAEQLQIQIAAGESFTCPIHKCHRCQQGENKDVHDLQFAICRRCPKSFHRKCLPRTIAFKGSADGTIQQRAWDNLLPKRILMYCTKHKIIPDIETPLRDHLLFPYIVRKRNQDGSRTEMLSQRTSKAFGNLKVTATRNMPNVVEGQSNTVIYGDPALEKGKSSTMHKIKSIDDSVSISRNMEQPSVIMRECLKSKPVKKMTVFTPPIDTNMKTRILKLMNDSKSSLNFEEFIEEKKRKCTRQTYAPQTGLDKTITMGKVEASVKAVRTALKKLEDGCSVEDAKAVCEPNILNQLIRWKRTLRVFLAPFLHGARYTSFGRHFTKVEKLEEIVARLHWYVEDGDMIVDFCCGSNDFSCFMKEKLDSMGKSCSFKNYDLITPKNTFNFEKRDWFSVPVDALPNGSRLVMGLNPPFGVQASLANKFIDHALKFKPKLIILIVPKETERLDQKMCPYDLIWEEDNMLSGKSFYLPGSVDVRNKPLDDWNVVPPLLSLWSRPDWTAKHKAVAEKNSHVKQKQTNPHEGAVSNYCMEENRNCFDDFSNLVTRHRALSTILDNVPEEPNGGQPQPGRSIPPTDNVEDTNMATDTGTHDLHQQTFVDLVDMDLSSPINSPMNHGSGPISVNPPYIQPSNYGPHPPCFGPPQYANTGVSYGPGSGAGYTYTQLGPTAFPSHPGSTSHYGQGDFTMTYMQQPPYGSYGHTTYPTNTYIRPQYPNPTDTYVRPQDPTLYGQPEYTSELDVWPPSTMPGDRRYS